MTKLRIDLTLYRAEDADKVRVGMQKLIDAGDNKVRLVSNKTVLELDYGPFDFERLGGAFADVKAMIGGRNPEIVQSCGTKEFKDEQKRLVDEARDEWLKFNYPPTDVSGSLNRDGKDAVDAVLATQPGLVLGGAHNDRTHREPIMDLLADGVASGRKKDVLVFVEELNIGAQSDIDAFLDAAPDAKMPAPLEKYLKLLTTYYKTDFVKMVQLAKANGARIYGTDEDDLKIYEDVPPAVHHERRCAIQNKRTAEVVDQAQRAHPGKKFVAMIGRAHSNTHQGGVPGLSQILGAPAVSVDASGRLHQDNEDPALRAQPKSSKARAEFLDGYFLKLRDAANKLIASGTPGALQDDVLDYKEQFAAASKMADLFEEGGMEGEILKDGANIDALVDSPRVLADVQRLIERAKQRRDRQEALVKLIETGKLDDFRKNLADWTKDQPDLLAQDGRLGPSVIVTAVKSGQAGLLAECAAKGAPVADPLVSKGIFQAIVTRHQSRQDTAKDVKPEDLDAELTKALADALTAGADPKGKNSMGDTPLQQLVEAGLGKQAAQLIQAGAAVTAKTVDGGSMLEAAVKAGKPGAIRALVAAGCDVNAAGSDGKPLLTSALLGKNAAMAKALVDAGANPNVKGPGGATALHLAAGLHDKSLLDALLAKGADASVADDAGATAATALLVEEVRRRVDEATNGDRRAVKEKTAQAAAKTDEIAAAKKKVDDLTAEDKALVPDLLRSTGANFSDKMARILQIRRELPAAKAQAATLTRERDALVAEVAQHKAADPLNALVAASEAKLVSQRDSVGKLEEVIVRARGFAARTDTDDASKDKAKQLVTDKQRELGELKAAIKAEEQRLARLLAPQPIDEELVGRAAARIAAGGAPASMNQVDALLAGAGPALTTLRDQMLDRQTKVQEMLAAVMASDAAKIDALVTADPTLVNARTPADDSGFTMLHKAARDQNLAMAQKLLEKGADPTLRDNMGSTPLHKVFQTRQDDRAKKTVQKQIVEKLVDGGADMNATDGLGRTGLHHACLDGNPDAITYLIGKGADQTVQDKRGWTAQDVVVATTKPIAEKAYADAARRNVSPALIGPGRATTDTVSLLLQATRCEDPGDVERVEAMYRNLYAEPTFQPMLDLIAMDAAHAHEAKGDGSATETGLRIVVARDQQVGLIYNSRSHNAPRGAYDETAHVAMVGAGQADGHFTAGTLIHELTHAAARIIYGEADIPCPKPQTDYLDASGKMSDDLAGSDYVKAILSDVGGAAALGGPPGTDAYTISDTLFGRMSGNYKDKGDKALLQEYLVGVPQLIAEFGRDAVHRVAPKLVQFYEGGFTGACKAMALDDRYDDVRYRIDNAELRAELDPPQVRPVDWTVSRKSAGTSVEGIVDTVRQSVRGQHGKPALSQADAGRTNLSLPCGPENFVLDAEAERTLERQLATLAKSLRESYDRESLPKELSAEMLREFTQELTRLVWNSTGKVLKAEVETAAGGFVRETRSKDLEARYADNQMLGNREVAELILIRAENKAWADAQAGGGGQPAPVFNVKRHAEAVDALAQEVGRYMDENHPAGPGKPLDPEARQRVRDRFLVRETDIGNFVTEEVKALAAGRAMKVKGDTVKIDTKRAKGVWFQKLQELAA